MEQALAIAIKEVVVAVRAKQMSCAEGVSLLSAILSICRAASTEKHTLSGECPNWMV